MRLGSQSLNIKKLMVNLDRAWWDELIGGLDLDFWLPPPPETIPSAVAHDDSSPESWNSTDLVVRVLVFSNSILNSVFYHMWQLPCWLIWHVDFVFGLCYNWAETLFTEPAHTPLGWSQFNGPNTHNPCAWVSIAPHSGFRYPMLSPFYLFVLIMIINLFA